MVEGESPTQASTPAGAVFLSYASQDAEAAKRICDALQAGGIEVWFDKSELRGGDAWDRQIRKQIQDCSLFVPIISQQAHERLEGYFRREWRLAVERAGDMAEIKAFLVPVVIDGTTERDPAIPEKFREVQWTRLPAGETPRAFVEHVQGLLSGEISTTTRAYAASRAVASIRGPAPATGWARRLLRVVVAVGVVVVVGYLAVDRPWISKPALFAPPPHSVAVLPFVNMSGDKEQEYFSDGLTEEVLNSLAHINELQVAARTSAFSFKGNGTDIGTIARKLNVGAVLEGSVRRSDRTVRVTAQLINAVTGFHIWSETYDRDLGDVLKLETDIADAVASALKVSLLGDAASKIEVGGTRNPAAFDAYLRGIKLARIAVGTTPMDCTGPVAAFTAAVALDSSFALAFAHRALISWECATNSRQWLEEQSIEAKVRTDAEQAIVLAPGLADGYLALSSLEQSLQHFEAADQACTRALKIAPGSAPGLEQCSVFAAFLGRFDTAVAGAQHAVALDPLNPLSHRALGDTLRFARRYDEAATAYQGSIAAAPDHSDDTYGLRGISYYLAGHVSLARSTCEVKADNYRSLICRAIIYEKLGRHGDAAKVFTQLMQIAGEASAYQYTEIQAQWGDRKSALDWLQKAVQIRDPGLAYTKVDPLLDPLRTDPRFQAVMRELKFPS